MGKVKESVEEILQMKVEDAFESYEERVSAVSKWGRGGDVQFSEIVGDSMYVMRLKLGESATCVEMAQAVAVADGMTEKMLGLVREVNEDWRRILARAMVILKNLKITPASPVPWWEWWARTSSGNLWTSMTRWSGARRTSKNSK